jgi:hypothetical protein
MSREIPALWEEALNGRPDTVDTLAGKIVALALAWAGGDPERLKQAARILARTPYLEGGKTP